MTPAELKSARKALGMTQSEFAAALLLSPKNGGRTVRVWESEGGTIPGPVQIAVNCLLNHGGTKQERENFSGKGKTAPEKSKDSTTW